jgi:hypothetical protein
MQEKKNRFATLKKKQKTKKHSLPNQMCRPEFH